MREVGLMGPTSLFGDIQMVAAIIVTVLLITLTIFLLGMLNELHLLDFTPKQSKKTISLKQRNAELKQENRDLAEENLRLYAQVTARELMLPWPQIEDQVPTVKEKDGTQE
jgi:cell division protein FtsX